MKDGNNDVGSYSIKNVNSVDFRTDEGKAVYKAININYLCKY